MTPAELAATFLATEEGIALLRESPELEGTWADAFLRSLLASPSWVAMHHAARTMLRAAAPKERTT